MCPLCVATGTIALVGAGSAGSLGALAAKVLHVMRRRGADQGESLALSDPAPEVNSEGRAVRVAYVGGDPFNALSGGL